MEFLAVCHGRPHVVSKSNYVCKVVLVREDWKRPAYCVIVCSAEVCRRAAIKYNNEDIDAKLVYMFIGK